MFLTTMRVRRARSSTFAEAGLKRLQGSAEFVEVTCHGAPIALLEAEAPHAVHWRADAYASHDRQLQAIAKNAIAVMAACPSANRATAAA